MPAVIGKRRDLFVIGHQFTGETNIRFTVKQHRDNFTGAALMQHQLYLRILRAELFDDAR